jgi:hypothetical protein
MIRQPATQEPGVAVTGDQALGGGKKLFADGSAPRAYRLTRSRISSTGIMIGHYERDGEIKIGGTAPDSPSEREIARQARIKREG